MSVINYVPSCYFHNTIFVLPNCHYARYFIAGYQVVTLKSIPDFRYQIVMFARNIIVGYQVVTLIRIPDLPVI